MARPREEPQLGACKMCGRKPHTRNLCHAHYRLLRLSGELKKLPPAPKTCTKCGKKAVSKGLCWSHYRQVSRVRRPPCHEGRHHQWTITGRCKVCQMEKPK